MHSETERYQVRDAAGERKPIEILSGGDYGRLKSFTPSCHRLYLGNHNTPLTPAQIKGITDCNQALANGAKSLIRQEEGASDIYYWLKYGFGFLYPGTNAH
jgi:hypothetical protein